MMLLLERENLLQEFSPRMGSGTFGLRSIGYRYNKIHLTIQSQQLVVADGRYAEYWIDHKSSIVLRMGLGFSSH